MLENIHVSLWMMLLLRATNIRCIFGSSKLFPLDSARPLVYSFACFAIERIPSVITRVLVLRHNHCITQGMYLATAQYGTCQRESDTV